MYKVTENCSFSEAFDLMNNGYDYAESENGDKMTTDFEGDIVTILKKGNTLKMNLKWSCYLENLRDEYWVLGNILVCNNGNRYKVISNDRAEKILGVQMEELYKYGYNLKFDYGVNKQWNIKYILDSDSKLLMEL